MTDRATSSAGPERVARPSGPKTAKAAQRFERDAAARRALFVASIAAILGAFVLIAASEPPGTANSAAPAAAASIGSDQRVLAEIPIVPVNGDARHTVVRIVAADNQPAAHVRTRAS